MNSTSRLACWLVMEALILATAMGETTPTAKNNPAGNDFAPLPGIFNSELPRMTLPADLRVTLRPRFGDLQSRDHLRLVWGLRYGLSPQWEVSSDIDSYIAHGLKDRSVLSTNGVSQVSFGAKYRFNDFLEPFWDTAAGIKYSVPIGHAPDELTDGLRHITPFMTMEHVFKRHPSVTGFVSFGLDLNSRALPRTNTDEHYGADTWFVTPGLTWKRGPVKYSLEVTFRSSAGLDTSDTYDVTVRPGMAWTLPPNLTFNSRNRWVLGVGLSAGLSDHGSSFGINTRIQTDFDFRRIFYTPKSITARR
jgi:hypothetical protein